MERDDLGPPVVPGGQKIGLGPRNLRPRAETRPTGRAVSRERLDDWDRPAVWAPLCLPPAKAPHLTKRRVGVEYSPLLLDPVRPEAV